MKKYITVDGNIAVANTAYAFSDIATIYPITPSSPMAGITDKWSGEGRLNMFGQPVKLVEMQSEAGAIGAVHGASQAGSLAVSFTSSQGLMLMVPVLYRISGERLPVVLHVASRTVGTHGMSIFGDHSDVMACRDAGWALLSSGSVQEAAEIAAVAHLSAIKANIPFIHFMDGFRTSHELCRIEEPDIEAMTKLMDMDALKAFRRHALNPEHPRLRNTVQNGDVYFQVREANNSDYEALPDVVEDYMAQVGKITGRTYHVFDYYGDPEAEDIIVAMGSVSGPIEEVVDYINARGGKTGFIQVHLYRPFSIKHFMSVLPKSVKNIAVLDRVKDMGAVGEPLYTDVVSVLAQNAPSIRIIGGRYGLSSKDTDPGQIMAVFNELKKESPKNGFTIGINDDVTHYSLESADMTEFYKEIPSYSCKFWGLGGDGTVGANHNTIQILGDEANMYAQAYFEYDAKKSFGTTKSHLRISKDPIRSSYYVKHADFVGCHNQSFVSSYEMAEELYNEGTFLLNCSWSAEELDEKLPASMKRELARKKANLYIIDATRIAGELGLGSFTNMVLQAAFFKVTNLMDIDTALEDMKKAAEATYRLKGEDVVARNIAAIERGASDVVKVEIPASWAEVEVVPETVDMSLPAPVRNILIPINKQKGDDLPVSAFETYKDGTIELGMTAYEKRGIAINIPKWDAEKCLQCNLCSMVCSHAVIRPYILNKEEQEAAPAGITMVDVKGFKPANEEQKAYKFTMAVSMYDCTGCGVCAETCPDNVKAIQMVPCILDPESKDRWDYLLGVEDKHLFKTETVKGSQFAKPLVEFSAACGGCTETPYAKLFSQLYGSRLYWANGTGCSQAWGAPMPQIPYTTDKRGFGPAYTNSLFENNAELMLGVFLSAGQRRAHLKMQMEAFAEKMKAEGTPKAADITALIENWQAAFDDTIASRKASDELIEALKTINSKDAADLLEDADQFAKKSFWMYGGDGWAYDIGYGGLDHVIAQGEDINVFVIDTEVYSNTGGQSSKATQRGAVAQFASSGKKTGKKDLGAIFRSYGNVYVAQVAMGANPAQLVKAITEAEAFKGPSIIIAYCPCTAHGIKGGMKYAQKEMKRAVESGYWNLYRFDPSKEVPMQIDSKEPTMDYYEFLQGETRFQALEQTFPENAKVLFAQAAEDAMRRRPTV